MKIIVHLILVIYVLALATLIASASDPAPLQDFCIVSDVPKNMVYVNGKFCKDPKKVTENDFFYSGLNIPRDTNNTFGVSVTIVNAESFPALNSQGVSMSLAEFGPYGIIPFQSHPRASEMVIVLKGKFLVGLVTSSNNRLFSRVLKAGGVFLVPQGLTHFALNLGKNPALALAAYGGQNPGFVTFPTSLFESVPEIGIEVLTKAFLLGKRVVRDLQEKLKNV